MYASLTRVSTSDQPIENATIIAEEMLSWLREIDGFEGLLMLSREGTTLGLTFWRAARWLSIIALFGCSSSTA